MLNYLVRQFGMMALGMCILASAVIVESRMAEIDRHMSDAVNYSATVNHLASAINASQLQPPAQYVSFKPKVRVR